VKRVREHHEVIMSENYDITFEDLTLEVVNFLTRSKLRLKFNVKKQVKLTLNIRGPQTILNKINGEFRSNEMTAIMVCNIFMFV
jgi:hypothetical protein